MSCIAGRWFTNWSIREAHIYMCVCIYVYTHMHVYNANEHNCYRSHFCNWSWGHSWHWSFSSSTVLPMLCYTQACPIWVLFLMDWSEPFFLNHGVFSCPALIGSLWPCNWLLPLHISTAWCPVASSGFSYSILCPYCVAAMQFPFDRLNKSSQPGQ